MRKSLIFLFTLTLLVIGWWLRPAVPPQVTRETATTTIATPANTPPVRDVPAKSDDALPAFLPPEAREILQLIARGGPFPNRQDGVIFSNREGHLPKQPRGWYHEYTVETPGLNYRGARRIITGGTPPQEYWYTDDHYESFHHFEYTPDRSQP
jgi:guanyl-specific ribonuclease Sa